MEPPSRHLIDLLSHYGLAGPADLRRCRRSVRRLAHDLPTFDSVWIDALTHSRVITPFQAKLLESEQPDRLRVGPCVLVDEWARDGRWTLRLARHRSTRQKCLLTFVDVPANDRPRALQQCRDMIARLRGLSHPSLVIPQGCDEVDGRIVIVSPYVTGPTLKQLLVRRGRFPIPVVTEIAAQLIDGLAALEQREIVHGDVTLTSVRLTARGHAVLLHPGVLPAVGNRISIHAPLGPESYDGAAPELISSGRMATMQSDLYALGCLLWQLLAGRPPFPTGDPLAKLAAHQTRPIDDIRRWVPDAPAELSALLRQLTEKSPSRRGSGPRELQKHWPTGTRMGRTRLAQFHSSFGSVAPSPGDMHPAASRFRLKSASALLVLLGGLLFSLLDASARNELLRLAGHPAILRIDPAAHSPNRPGQPADDRMASRPGQPGLLPFPTQPTGGVIELTAAGPYDVAELVVDGPLIIRGASGVLPKLVIGSKPLRITASQLRIERVHVVLQAQARPPAALLALTCQQLIVEHCRFDVSAPESDGGPAPTDHHRLPSAIAWKTIDPANPTGGKALLKDTVLRGPLHALQTHTLPRLVRIDNCLKRGDGVLTLLTHLERSAPLHLSLHQTTLRDCGGVVGWSPQAAQDGLQPLLLVAEDSVLDVPPDQGALLSFGCPSPPAGWEGMIRITGEGSLIRPGTLLAAAQSSTGTGSAPLEASRLRVEGLLIDEFDFAAASDQEIAASVVASTQAPRSSPTPPGINADRLADSTPPPITRTMGDALIR